MSDCACGLPFARNVAAYAAHRETETHRWAMLRWRQWWGSVEPRVAAIDELTRERFGLEA